MAHGTVQSHEIVSLFFGGKGMSIPEHIGHTVVHGILAWTASYLVKAAVVHYLERMKKSKSSIRLPYYKQHLKLSSYFLREESCKLSSEDGMPVHILFWLIMAPFLCMLMTPYLINTARKLWTGNHHTQFFVRKGGSLFGASATVYGFEFSPSDFLVLEGEYYIAIPIWSARASKLTDEF